MVMWTKSPYKQDIEGPIFVVVSLDIQGAEYEVEAYITTPATGEWYEEWDTGARGWTNTTDPDFIFEGYDDEGVLLIFNESQLRDLEEKATELFWDKVRG